MLQYKIYELRMILNNEQYKRFNYPDKLSQILLCKSEAERNSGIGIRSRNLR